MFLAGEGFFCRRGGEFGAEDGVCGCGLEELDRGEEAACHGRGAGLGYLCVTRDGGLWIRSNGYVVSAGSSGGAVIGEVAVGRADFVFPFVLYG